jgi:hypothetical protein
MDAGWDRMSASLRAGGLAGARTGYRKVFRCEFQEAPVFSSRSETEVAIMRTVPASGVDAAAGRTADEVRAEEAPTDEATAERLDHEADERDEAERGRARDVEEETAMPAVATVDRTTDLDEPTLDERIPTEPRKTARPVAKPVRTGGFTHTSLAASTSLFLGTAGLAAAFSGALAPVGVALGALAVIFAGFGLVMAGRDRVTGHGVAVVGLLLGLGAVSVAALVMAGDLSWLSSTTDGAGKARAWLNDHLRWMRDW